VSVPNTDAQTIPPFLDAAALQALTALLDETPPQVVLAAFQNVDDNDAALFFCDVCTVEK
jgi:NADPH-dependent ferric siderophore reductase